MALSVSYGATSSSSLGSLCAFVPTRLVPLSSFGFFSQRADRVPWPSLVHFNSLVSVSNHSSAILASPTFRKMQTNFILIAGLLACLILFHVNTVVDSSPLENSDEQWNDLSSEDVNFNKRLSSAKFASGLGKRLSPAKFASGLGKRLSAAKFASGLGKRLSPAKFASGLGKRDMD